MIRWMMTLSLALAMGCSKDASGGDDGATTGGPDETQGGDDGADTSTDGGDETQSGDDSGGSDSSGDGGSGGSDSDGSGSNGTDGTDSSGDDGSSGPGSSGTDTPSGTGAGTGTDACAAESRDDDFMVGLEKAGDAGEITVTVVAATPAMPIKGDNDWTLRIEDGDGTPLGGLDVEVNPWMPDHGHGTPVAATVTPAGAPGEYAIAPINLFMSGYWEVALDVGDAGGALDSLSINVCVNE